MGIGAAIAVNGVPDPTLAMPSLIEVQEVMGEPTTYRLHYSIDIQAGDLPLLNERRLDVGSMLSILVPVGHQVQCLVKGPVRGQQIHLQHGGAGSRLEVIGADSTIAMDRETQTQVWSNVTDSEVVQVILGRYGYLPDLQPTNSRHLETKHSLIQRESDHHLVRRLARRNGYLFWVTCDAVGVETAHFKRPPLEGKPTTELRINVNNPNVQSLDLMWDVERPTKIEAKQLDLNTKTAMDGSVSATPQRLLGQQGLQTLTAGDRRTLHLVAPTDDVGDLQARSEGALIEADWFVRATCQTSLNALGDLVRSHTLVTLQGAGQRHSGTYWVTKVHHQIDAAAHRMTVELVRNALGA